MNCIKITRKGSIEPFKRTWFRNIQSGSFKKDMNSIGEINLTTENLNTADDIIIDDFVEVYINGNRLTTGYVVDVKTGLKDVVIKVYTEEVKLLKSLCPDSYEPNVTGLSVEALAEFCGRSYKQARYSDKAGLKSIVKDITDITDTTTDQIVLVDSFFKKTQANQTPVGGRAFYSNVIDDVNEKGVYRDSNEGWTQYVAQYDRVLTITLHDNYLNGSYGLNVKDTAKVSTLGEMMLDENLYVDLVLYDKTGTWISYNHIATISSTGFAFIPDGVDTSIVGLRVVGGRGRLLKVYIDSSKNLFSQEIEALLTGNFFDQDTAITKTCAIITTPGTINFGLNQANKYFIKGYVPVSTFGNITETRPVFLDRIRWREKYRTFQTSREEWIYPRENKWYEVWRLKPGATKRIYSLGGENPSKIYIDFQPTNNVYDSLKLPTASVVNDNNNGFYHTDFTGYTEMVGYLLNRPILSDEDIYFGIRIQETYLTEDGFSGSDRWEVLDGMLDSELFHAIEFVYYRQDITTSVSDDIKDLITVVSEADNTPMFDIIKKVCEDLNLLWWVSDSVLYIDVIGSVDNIEYFLADGLNCVVEDINVAEEVYFNEYKVFGKGDSIINRPLVTNYINNIDGVAKPYDVNKQKSIATDIRSYEDIESNIDLITIKNNPNASIKTSITIQDTEIINVGDVVDLLVSENDRRYTLFVTDVSYNFTANSFTAKISTGDVKKLV